MSDLGMLFRFRSGGAAAPLENFTSTAIAIAINHDPRPMVEALRKVSRAGHESVAYPVLDFFATVTAAVRRRRDSENSLSRQRTPHRLSRSRAFCKRHRGPGVCDSRSTRGRAEIRSRSTSTTLSGSRRGRTSSPSAAQ